MTKPFACCRGGHSAKWGDDFGADEETTLSKEYEKPVIVHRYPTAMKAFYMATDSERPELSLSFDMIAPEGYGEIIGGGERQSDYDTLLRRIRESNLPEDVFQWYLDLRRYGSVPHAGFGLGLERTVAWILRNRTHSRGHSLPSHALSRLSLISQYRSANARSRCAPKINC